MDMKEFHTQEKELSMVFSDSTSLNVTHFFSNNESDIIIICLPAMGVTASYYKNIAKILCNEGFNVITADQRGNGKSSIRASKKINFGYNEIITIDIPELIKKVKEQHPEKEIYILGHSLGGQLAVLAMSINERLANGIILIASCSGFYKGWNFPSNIINYSASRLIYLITKSVGYFPGDKLGFAGREGKNIIFDWAQQIKTGNYVLCNSQLDYETMIEKISVPILAISFENDSLAPRRSVENFYKKMKNCSVEHKHCTSENVNIKNVGHFNWIKKPDAIVEMIKEWIYKNKL